MVKRTFGKWWKIQALNRAYGLGVQFYRAACLYYKSYRKLECIRYQNVIPAWSFPKNQFRHLRGENLILRHFTCGVYSQSKRRCFVHTFEALERFLPPQFLIFLLYLFWVVIVDYANGTDFRWGYVASCIFLSFAGDWSDQLVKLCQSRFPSSWESTELCFIFIRS